MLINLSIKAQNYYNVNNQPITQQEFDSLKLFKYHQIVKNDSLQAYKLIDACYSREIGSLGDPKNLLRELNEKLNLKLDDSKPLIIYYYPGKDLCNSSDTATRQSKIKWYKQLGKKIKRVADVNTIMLYKNSEGIKTLEDFNWKKDPNGLIENLFFNYHYDCGSYVIINNDKYGAYFGEYVQAQVVESLIEILKK